jgi:DNA-binding MarR family transcriptional regulator
LAFDPDRYADLSGFRFALRRFLAASEAINREAGITQQQYQAMLAVRAWPGEAMAVKDLADELMLTHHAAVQLVDRLAKQDLVERRPSRDDRRIVLLQLTKKGLELLGQLAALHLDELRRQEPQLTRSLGRIKNGAR